MATNKIRTNLDLLTNNITNPGIIGTTGARATKVWATDMEVTNAIVGSITGNAATVTTNANLTGAVTSVGNATSLGSFTSANLAGALTDETGSGAAVFANSPALVTPDLGTPSAATLTNATGLPISTGVSGLGSGVATFLATPSSANLASAVTDETGSGALVFAASPALTGTPTAPTASAGTNTTQLATTAFVSTAIGNQFDGLSYKEAVRAATTAALPANTRVGNVLTADANGALPAQDGVTLIVGDRILVKNEATGANNGIFTVTDLGSAGTPFILTRSTDADISAEVTPGMSMFISEGTTNGDQRYTLSTDAPITLNTTALVFVQTSGTGQITAGNALSKTGNTLDVNVDNSSIEISADALQVKALGITNAMLAGSITDSKLNTITTANKVSGSAVQLGTNGGLSDSTGLIVNVDGTTIEKPSGVLGIKDAGVSFAKLAASAKPYVADFTTGDFTAGVYTLTGATHGLGVNIDFVVEEDDGTNYVNVTGGVTVYSIKASGNVKIEVTVGQEFNGRLIVRKIS